MNSPAERTPQLVYGRKETRLENIVGKIRGQGKNCTLESCRGWRFPVRWPNGKLTWPCTKGMTIRDDGEYQIL